jgi:hypothetical protein
VPTTHSVQEKGRGRSERRWAVPFLKGARWGGRVGVRQREAPCGDEMGRGARPDRPAAGGWQWPCRGSRGRAACCAIWPT